MALVVEDGTGLATANAYISVAFADAHHLRFATETWAGAASAKEAAIQEATLFVDLCWAELFKGHRFRSDPNDPAPQALAWPRDQVVRDEDSFIFPVAPLPDCLEEATAELALLSLTIGLYPAAEQEGVSVITLRAGRFTETREFGSTAGIFDQPSMRKAMMLLRPVLAKEMSIPNVRT